MQRALIASLLALALVGCSSTPADPTKTVVQSDKKVTSTADLQTFNGNGYSFTFPKDWKALNMTQGEMSEISKTASSDKDFAGAAQILNNPEMVKSFKFFAAIPKLSAGEYKANVNVLELEVPGSMSPEEFFKTNYDQLSKMADGSVGSEDLPGNVPGKVYRWSHVFNGLHAKIISQVYLKDKTQVVVTYTYPADSDAAAKDELDPVIKSFHWN